MQRKFYLTIVSCIFIVFLKAQTAPPLRKQMSLGGSLDDMTRSIRQTKDSGFIVIGYTLSSDGDVIGNHAGSAEYWIIKMNKSNKIQWKKTLGGNWGDIGQDIQQTPDGGYIVAGFSSSYDGDVTGHHNDIVYANYDYWVVKLDDKGNIQWQKSLGGNGDDFAESVQCTNDKGYIVAGYSNSTDGDVTNNHGGNDYWVVKLDSLGKMGWQKSLGGSGDDFANVVITTGDKGYLIAGASSSTDGDMQGNHGDYDFWVVRLNERGSIISQKSFGGSNADMALTAQETSDNGFVIAGRSVSSNGDVSVNKGSEDCWIIKINRKNKILWQKSFGGSANDVAYSIQQTKDSGYIVAGSTESTDGDVTGNHGGADMWILKLNAKGVLQWQKCAGGSSHDYCYSTTEGKAGLYMAAGICSSSDGDVTVNHGGYDYWIVRFGPSTQKNIANVQNNIVANPKTDITIKVAPNPITSFIRLQTHAAIKNAVVRILDLNGKVFYTRSLDLPTSGFVDLPADNLHKGNYIVEIATGDFKKSFTVMKQ